jgi:hypothetical protein
MGLTGISMVYMRFMLMKNKFFPAFLARWKGKESAAKM